MSTCSSLFITNRFRITVSHHCFLCPEEDERVTVDQFCIGCFTCMPVADNCKGSFVRWLLSISPKLTEGAGQDLWAIFHPLLFGTQEDVCCHLRGLFLCLRAHSMAGASSFGQHSLLQGVLPPWADICLLGCHSSILSSLWNLFGGLSFPHVMAVDQLANCGHVFTRSSPPSPLQILGTALFFLSYTPLFCSTLSAVTFPSYLSGLWFSLCRGRSTSFEIRSGSNTCLTPTGSLSLPVCKVETVIPMS